MTIQTTSAIVRFYGGAGTDNLGRKLEDMWEWTDDQLESVHNYIQWMFPSNERSAFNADAPVLCDEEAEMFLNSPYLQDRVRASLVRILGFYGFEMDKTTDRGQVVIVPVNVNEKAPVWLTPHNHNFLRITRILKCLCLTGLKGEAVAFLTALQFVYISYSDAIGEETLKYWQAAIK